MALQFADRVFVTSSTYTTSSFTLGSAVTGYQSFTALTSGNTTYYGATDLSGNWEVGLGTYTTGSLARTTIIASSNQVQLFHLVEQLMYLLHILLNMRSTKICQAFSLVR